LDTPAALETHLRTRLLTTEARALDIHRGRRQLPELVDVCLADVAAATERDTSMATAEAVTEVLLRRCLGDTAAAGAALFG